MPKRVNPGEFFEPEARVWNHACKLYEESTGGMRGPDFRRQIRNNSTILVQNLTGQDLDWYQPVALAEAAINPNTDLASFLDKFALNVRNPPSMSTPYNFAITQEPIQKNQFGEVLVSGVTAVLIDIPSSGAAVQFAGPNGTFVSLQRANCGFCRVVWMGTNLGNGKAWAIVNLG